MCVCVCVCVGYVLSLKDILARKVSFFVEIGTTTGKVEAADN